VKIRIEHGLPFVEAELTVNGKTIFIAKTLIDTGSAKTAFAADLLAQADIRVLPEDILYQVRGVGGTEYVFLRHLDSVKIGNLEQSPFEIEVAGMDYGFDIEGIIGLDFLLQTEAVIDLARRELKRKRRST
jgi:predicted aspartyl protease